MVNKKTESHIQKCDDFVWAQVPRHFSTYDVGIYATLFFSLLSFVRSQIPCFDFCLTVIITRLFITTTFAPFTTQMNVFLFNTFWFLALCYSGFLTLFINEFFGKFVKKFVSKVDDYNGCYLNMTWFVK